MILLIDLDGTLVNTAHESFKPVKDGQIDTDTNYIPVFDGAIEFIESLVNLGHTPIIVSDSVSKYVKPIVNAFFKIPSISLSRKPNTKAVEDFFAKEGLEIKKCDEIIVVGDTWLDIELGRALGYKTILTQFYRLDSKTKSKLDGIGQTWNHLKSGPTYVAKTYNEILNILNSPLDSLWSAEAEFQNFKSNRAIKLFDFGREDGLKIFRALGRQEDGECDKYAIAKYYKEFQREDRSSGNLLKLASSFQSYIQCVKDVAPHLTWDYFTYVSDKATTVPPNKLKILFELIDIGIPKSKMLEWKEEVDGSIRNRPHYRDRKVFIENNLFVSTDVDLTGKSIIVLDDQFTTGGTAYAVTNMLKGKGAMNILFITLFFMTSSVMSNKTCPRCGKTMQIKMKKDNGNRFYSCTPPTFKGNGCGYIESYV